MPKQIKTCRVCGVRYEACKSIRTGSTVFNWREVACSPECGMKYFESISASRNDTGSQKADECVELEDGDTMSCVTI